MPTPSRPITAAEYNQARTFAINSNESRLKKAARSIRSLKVGTLLDLGCSTGEWMSFWKTQGWKVAGVDVNPAAVRSAVRKGLPAKTCDLGREPLPFRAGSFDLIFAGEVIEHLVDTDFFLRECARCLRPGGHLLITTPNLASWENRFRLALGRYPRWLDYRLTDCGHVRGYTPGALKRQVREQGFELIQHVGNWVPFVPQSWLDDVKAPWLAWTGDWFPNLAMDIILLVRKGVLPGQQR